MERDFIRYQVISTIHSPPIFLLRISLMIFRCLQRYTDKHRSFLYSWIIWSLYKCPKLYSTYTYTIITHLQAVSCCDRGRCSSSEQEALVLCKTPHSIPRRRKKWWGECKMRGWNWAFGGTGLCRQDTQQLGPNHHHIWDLISKERKKTQNYGGNVQFLLTILD